MAIFNFTNDQQRPTPYNGDDNNPTQFNGNQPLPEIDENIFIEKNVPKPQFNTTNTQRAEQPTDNNINLLYSFLDRNHEAKGYDDALVNPDSSHLNQNLDALKSELIRTIKKVKTFYEDFIQETEYHIISRSRNGLVDIVEELEMKKRIAVGHLEKVKIIQDSTENNEGDCKGIMISYTRGFKNGLAAISHYEILKRKF
ncbi:hypothetical protein LT679_06165 [Mucilaginibacter roseus]|uniref:Uncharacterized protein n=1 Tax=Mucilaginibacter roseus TaxID=1528868 RepID=A0ABS8U0J8_9SPHI|nr:hypothetical protein [Mucilaginibacter roseus]MCD8740182.1 hypothetical protein [Mucilaginibacter roseus]